MIAESVDNEPVSCSGYTAVIECGKDSVSFFASVEEHRAFDTRLIDQHTLGVLVVDLDGSQNCCVLLVWLTMTEVEEIAACNDDGSLLAEALSI